MTEDGSDLQIDRNALDEMLMRQPSLFWEYSDACALAGSERDVLKEAVASVAARLDDEIRKANTGGRITEAAISQKIQLHSEHQIVMQKYLAARLRADQVLAKKEAFHQRGFMLRDLAQLFIAGYWSDDAVGGAAGRQVRAVVARERVAAERERIRE